jgi:3-mercaptopyruvate sulfurtransferase SseA
MPMSAAASLLFLALVAGPRPAQAQATTPTPAPTPSPAPRMVVADCEKLVAAGEAVIVDVRDAASYSAGHIKGALSIPLGELAAKTDELKKGGKVVVAYCG